MAGRGGPAGSAPPPPQPSREVYPLWVVDREETRPPKRRKHGEDTPTECTYSVFKCMHCDGEFDVLSSRLGKLKKSTIDDHLASCAKFDGLRPEKSKRGQGAKALLAQQVSTRQCFDEEHASLRADLEQHKQESEQAIEQLKRESEQQKRKIDGMATNMGVLNELVFGDIAVRSLGMRSGCDDANAVRMRFGHRNGLALGVAQSLCLPLVDEGDDQRVLDCARNRIDVSNLLLSTVPFTYKPLESPVPQGAGLLVDVDRLRRELLAQQRCNAPVATAQQLTLMAPRDDDGCATSSDAHTPGAFVPRNELDAANKRIDELLRRNNELQRRLDESCDDRYSLEKVNAEQSKELARQRQKVDSITQERSTLEQQYRASLRAAQQLREKSTHANASKTHDQPWR